jgi:hypothetical protein
MAITCYLFPKTMLATAIPEGDTTNQISHTTKTQIFGPYACDLGTWTGLAKRTDLEGLHQLSSSRPRLDRRQRPAAARWGQHLCGAMQELGGSAMGCRRGQRRSGVLEARPPTNLEVRLPTNLEARKATVWRGCWIREVGGKQKACPGSHGGGYEQQAVAACGGARLLPTEAPGWGKPKACDGGARGNRIS